MSYQTLLDSIGRVVGGTAPDATNRPRWFSGVETGDSTGVSGLSGCYSVAQAGYMNAPVAVLEPSSFELLYPPGGKDVLIQGNEFNVDNIFLRVLVNRSDPETEMSILNVFRDSVPAAFRTHMQLFSSPNVISAHCSHGRLIAWGPTATEQYIAWEFNVRVIRDLASVYSA